MIELSYRRVNTEGGAKKWSEKRRFSVSSGGKIGVKRRRELKVMAAVEVGAIRSAVFVRQLISALMTLFVGLQLTGGGEVPR